MSKQSDEKRPPPAENDVGPRITEGGVRAGRDIHAGRDIAGRDILSQSSPPGLLEALAQWQAQMESRIEAHPSITPDEKKDLKEQVTKIQAEAGKGKEADPGRLEKLINVLAVMAPDIFEVAVVTLANPLAGIGLVLKKIGEKAKIESKA